MGLLHWMDENKNLFTEIMVDCNNSFRVILSIITLNKAVYAYTDFYSILVYARNCQDSHSACKVLHAIRGCRRWMGSSPEEKKFEKLLLES